MPNKKSYVRRYTTLESLKCILCKKAITLLDYQTWDDDNDISYLRLYKQEKKLKSLLVLCLTRASERFHLWEVFGPKKEKDSHESQKPTRCGSYNKKSDLAKIGVRIRFDRNALIREMKKQHGIKCRVIKYWTLGRIERLAREPGKDPLANFPFLKRYGFRDEKEFRIIYESKSENVQMKDVPIELSCINKIIFSPRLDRSEFERIREELHAIPDCQDLKITHSRLTDSEVWQQAGKDVVTAAQKRDRTSGTR
jgi:hypothetical protein